MLRSVEGGSDTSVQGTNDDAQVSKLSCSKLGYFRDEFIQYFVKRASRRSPLINRGYYSRHAALRQLLNSFLAAAREAGQQPQVLVLGAGFDTTWFQLAKDGGGAPPYKCLEVDFREVTRRKCAVIAKEPALHNLLVPLADQQQQHTHQQPPHDEPPQDPPQASPAPPPTAPAPAPASAPALTAPNGTTATPSNHTHGLGPSPSPGPTPGLTLGLGLSQGHHAPGSAAAAAPAIPPPPSLLPHPAVQIDAAAGELVSPYYTVLPVDLRDGAALAAAMQRAGLDTSAPTYVLSECVLVYMEPAHSSPVLAWAAATFPNAMVAIYEQVRPDDAFGRQMVSNLEARGCPLKGLPATPTLKAHKDRLLAAGWSWADARDMDSLYKDWLDPDDRARAERLELFDELEEWHMIQEHYCIALGRNDDKGWLRGVGFEPGRQRGQGQQGQGAARRLPLAD